MKKLAVLFTMFMLLNSCSKDELDLSDPTVYKWKIETFSREAPPNFEGQNINGKWLVSVEFVELTNAQIAELKRKTSEVQSVIVYETVYTNLGPVD
ncbi:hypothetical protein ACFQ2C_14585 [Sphingobacterium daejeonense]|uniref:Uncharacterized protein n=1 Tax=Sphingobacterium daejeonense TaxID=371142 RepID=A0ABW3RPH0_9SPHI